MSLKRKLDQEKNECCFIDVFESIINKKITYIESQTNCEDTCRKPPIYSSNNSNTSLFNGDTATLDDILSSPCEEKKEPKNNLKHFKIPSVPALNAEFNFYDKSGVKNFDCGLTKDVLPSIFGKSVFKIPTVPALESLDGNLNMADFFDKKSNVG